MHHLIAHHCNWPIEHFTPRRLQWQRSSVVCWLMSTLALRHHCCRLISVLPLILWITNDYYNELKSILWLKSYLLDHRSFVSMGASKSNTITQSTGVPQGSVLMPLLFSIFTTNIGLLISRLGILYHQQADDTKLYTSLNMGNGHSTLQFTTCTEAVTRWHLKNGLLLNQSKSEALITGSRHQAQSFDATQGFCIAGSTVPFVNNIRLLEVTVDNHLINTSQQYLDNAIITSVHYVT